VSVEDAEHRRVRADAESERDDGNESEAGRATQRLEGEAKVVHRVQSRPLTSRYRASPCRRPDRAARQGLARGPRRSMTAAACPVPGTRLSQNRAPAHRPGRRAQSGSMKSPGSGSFPGSSPGVRSGMVKPYLLWPACTGTIALLGGLVAVRRPWSAASGWDKLIALGPLFVAVPLATFGAEHMVNATFIARMVPVWLPGR